MILRALAKEPGERFADADEMGRALEACREAMLDGLPVVLTSRCPAGAARPLYGFPGGGRKWADAGAIFAGRLHPLKARVALALALGAGLGGDDLAALLQE